MKKDKKKAVKNTTERMLVSRTMSFPVTVQIEKETPQMSFIISKGGMDNGMCDGVKYSTQNEALGRGIRILYEKPNGEKGYYDVDTNKIAQAIIRKDMKGDKA